MERKLVIKQGVSVNNKENKIQNKALGDTTSDWYPLNGPLFIITLCFLLFSQCLIHVFTF